MCDLIDTFKQHMHLLKSNTFILNGKFFLNKIIDGTRITIRPDTRIVTVIL